MVQGDRMVRSNRKPSRYSSGTKYSRINRSKTEHARHSTLQHTLSLNSFSSTICAIENQLQYAVRRASTGRGIFSNAN